MSALIELIQALLPRFTSEADANVAYLNEAVDLYDLERRMREVDARGRADNSGLRLGLLLH
jgi:hypothetical protein